jgi:hypothetical protein
MSRELSFLLADLGSFVCLIPSVIALFRLRRADREQRLLSLLVWIGTFISLAAYALPPLFHLPNLPLLHVYTIIDFVMLTLLYRPVLHPGLFRLLILVFPVFAAVNSLFFTGPDSMNELSRSISAFIIMAYALSFFAKTLRDMKVIHLERTPLFWISIGALYYNAASFFIFIFSKDLAPFKDMWLTYFGVHAIFTILLYLFYSIALWIRPEQPPIYPTS